MSSKKVRCSSKQEGLVGRRKWGNESCIAEPNKKSKGKENQYEVRSIVRVSLKPQVKGSGRAT